MYTIDRDIVCLGMNEPLRHALVLSDPLPPLFPSVRFSSSVDSVSVSLFPRPLVLALYYVQQQAYLPPSFHRLAAEFQPGRERR